MLVITRKPGESFVMGDGQKISILEIGKDRVKIGIDAPRDVRVVRSEVLETERSNVEAVHSEGGADLSALRSVFGATSQKESD